MTSKRPGRSPLEKKEGTELVQEVNGHALEVNMFKSDEISSTEFVRCKTPDSGQNVGPTLVGYDMARGQRKTWQVFNSIVVNIKEIHQKALGKTR